MAASAISAVSRCLPLSAMAASAAQSDGWSTKRARRTASLHRPLCTDRCSSCACAGATTTVVVPLASRTATRAAENAVMAGTLPNEPASWVSVPVLWQWQWR